MFTGIIESLGKVSRIDFERNRADLFVENPVNFNDVKEGSSICINGSCLTVLSKKIESTGETYHFDVSGETLEKTTLKQLKGGSIVNIERSLTLQGRLDGHLVLGHVDTMVKIKSIEHSSSKGRIVEFEFDSIYEDFFIEKGSAALNGISLTVFDVTEKTFKCVILPFTWENTNFKTLKEGDKLNCEADVVGKYVKKFIKPDNKKKTIDMEFLRKHGF